MSGDSHDVIAEYMRLLSLYRGNNLDDPAIRRKGNGMARFTWIEVLDEKDEPMDSILEGRPFKISLKLRVESSLDLQDIRITFVDKMGRSILTTGLGDSLEIRRLDRGTYSFSVFINPNPFVRGGFSLKLSCQGRNFQEYDTIDYAYNLSITPNLEPGDALSKRAGVVKIPFEWSMDRHES